MSRETSDSIIECTNENPIAMCDEAEPTAKGCACCKYGTISSIDHGLVVATLHEEITFLKNKLRTGTLGGEGSHWKGCEETHIDCARKVMDTLRDEVKELKIALEHSDSGEISPVDALRILEQVPDRVLYEISPALLRAVAAQISAALVGVAAPLGDIVEPCEESAEKDGGDDV